MSGERVQLDFDGDPQGAINALQKIIDKKNQLIRGMNKDSKASAKMMGKAHSDVHRRWNDDLKNIALSYVSIQGVVAGVTNALRAMNEERKRGADVARQAEASLGKLVQLGGGDPERVKKLIANAERNARQGGVSLGQGADLEFTLQSMQMGGQGGYFSKFYGISDPKQLAEGVGTLQKALGVGETGNSQQVLSKLFAASGVSKTTIEQFAPAATIAAQSAKAIGATDEEFLATLAQISRPAKSADVAAAQLDAFQTVLMKKGMGGRGIVGAARDIGEEGFFQEGPLRDLIDKHAAKRAKVSARTAPELISTADDRAEAVKQYEYSRSMLERQAKPGETEKQKETRQLRLAEMERRHQGNLERLMEREDESRQKRDLFLRKRDNDLEALDKKFRTDREAIEQSPVGEAAMKFFGRKEAFRGWSNIMAMQGEIESTTAMLDEEDLAAREGRGLAGRIAGSVSGVPLLDALKKERQAKTGMELTGMKRYAKREAGSMAELYKVLEESDARGEAQWKRTGRKIAGGVSQYLGARAETVRTIAEDPLGTTGGALLEGALAINPVTAPFYWGGKALGVGGMGDPVKGKYDLGEELEKHGKKLDKLGNIIDKNSEANNANTKGTAVPGAGVDTGGGL